MSTGIGINCHLILRIQMIIIEKQIMQLMQAVQIMAFRHLLDGKEEESKRILAFLKQISDQQSYELKEIK